MGVAAVGSAEYARLRAADTPELADLVSAAQVGAEHSEAGRGLGEHLT